MASSAQFRSSQRDDRRRRLLADEALGEPALAAASGMRTRLPTEHKTQRYGDGEILASQPRLMDLIPHQRLPLALWFGAGVLVIAALEGLCAYLCTVEAKPAGLAVVFDLSRKDCLGAWCAQLTLMAAAGVSSLVFSIRRHRTDDYQGRYRVWVWAAIAWLFVAADKSASFHEAFQQTMIQMSGTTLMGDGALWWMIPYLLIGGAIATRLFWDLRESWPTYVTLSLAASAYAVALAVRLTALPNQPILHQAMLQQGAELSGHWLGLLATCLYLRHVIRDAEGLVPLREAKPLASGVDKPAEVGENAASATDGETTATSTGGWRGVDPPHSTPPAPVQSRVTTTAAVADPPRPATATPAPVATESHANQKMSKAEKRALKERLMHERLQRQEQTAKWGR